MLDKKLTYLSLCPLLFLGLCASAEACDPVDSKNNFGGFSKGFLSKKSSPPNNALEKRVDVEKATGHTPKESPKPTDFPVTANLWYHPYFYTKEARQKILEALPSKARSIAPFFHEKMDILFDARGDKIGTVCHSTEFLTFFLAIKRLLDDQNFSQKRIMASDESRKAHPLPFIMQVMEHRVLASYFQYMDTLTAPRKQALQAQLRTPDSDHTQGEIILNQDLWDKLTYKTPKPTVRYFADFIGDQHPIYHLYYRDSTPGLMNFSIPIFNHPGLKSYGDLELIDHIRDDRFNSAGYLLDDKQHLVTTPGIVFIKRQAIREDEVLFYDHHPTFNQMFFFQMASIVEQSQADPFFHSLLNPVGGFARLNQDKFIFIPTPNPTTDTAVSPVMARLILPYLYEIKEEVQHHPSTYNTAQIGWIDQTIEGLKTTLVEEELAQENKALDQEIVQEIAETEINQELENKSSPLFSKIAEAQNAIHETGEKRKKLRKRAKTKTVQEVKKEKAETISPALIRSRRKEKALAAIEKEYTAKASLKQNFSTQDVKELVGEMISGLVPLGLETTGEAHVRGSHAAFQILDKDSGHTTRLGIAARPQKQGYQSGTVKAIIKDMVKKVSAIVGQKKS